MPSKTDVLTRPRAFDDELLAALPRMRIILKNRRKYDWADYEQKLIARALASWQYYTIGTNIRAWLTLMAKNLILNDERRRAIVGFVSIDALDEPSFSARLGRMGNAETRLELKEICAYIDRLPPEHAQTLTLIAQGYSYPEIAEKTKIPLGTVKSRASRGRAALQLLIDG
jgi:RNA polymerase sigma-70 factor (ECF subfamily)